MYLHSHEQLRFRLNQLSTLTRTATTPNQPAFADESAYIDLAALMNNRNVTFQLPANNATWLALHEWIQQESDLTTAVTYVKKLRFKLPVRFAFYRRMPEGVTVTIRSIDHPSWDPRCM